METSIFYHNTPDHVCPQHTSTPLKKYSAGITLIELVIALAILGILSMIAIPPYQGYIDKSNNTTTIVDLTTIGLALERYQITNNNDLPDSLSDIGLDTMSDPWGNPYHYTNIATTKGIGALRKDRNLVPINTDYDLYSNGKDGSSVAPLTAAQSQDDIIRANNGSYIGLASAY